MKNIIVNGVEYTPVKEIKEVKEFKRWRAEEGEKYYVMDKEGINYFFDSNDGTDNYLYNIGNYFKTEEEAQKETEKRLAIVKVNDRIRELNESWEPDWDSSNEYKYNLYYYKGYFHYDTYCMYKHSEILDYIKSEKIAKQIIKELTNELNLIFNI